MTAMPHDGHVDDPRPHDAEDTLPLWPTLALFGAIAGVVLAFDWMIGLGT